MQDLKPYIEKKLIKEQSHPEKESLKIYNYTPKCQFDRSWDDTTRKCRGLIVDTETGEIVANPFPKFFNFGEEDIKLPKDKPIVYDKLDGSLGILYWLNDKPYIATRGSFVSDQALWATEWFRENVNVKSIDKTKTYLFEIIYRKNRIVVQYDFEGLVLLAIRDTKTGKDEELKAISLKSGKDISIADSYHETNIKMLKSIQQNDAEGFVIFYPSTGLRMKIKFEEYVRLHRILTGVSNIAVWTYLRDGKDFGELLDRVPDEFNKWLKETIKDLNFKYTLVDLQYKEDFEKIPKGERKAQAQFIVKCRYSSVLFLMLDKRDYSQIIWKMVRPKFSKPFTEEI